MHDDYAVGKDESHPNEESLDGINCYNLVKDVMHLSVRVYVASQTMYEPRSMQFNAINKDV